MERFTDQPLGPRPHIAVFGSDKVGNFVLTTPLLHHLPAHLSGPAHATTHHGPRPTSMNAIHRATEKEVLLAALERNHYNRLATARELGIHKSTLFRKLKKLQLDLPGIDGRTQGSPPQTVA